MNREINELNDEKMRIIGEYTEMNDDISDAYLNALMNDRINDFDEMKRLQNEIETERTNMFNDMNSILDGILNGNDSNDYLDTFNCNKQIFNAKLIGIQNEIKNIIRNINTLKGQNERLKMDIKKLNHDNTILEQDNECLDQKKQQQNDALKALMSPENIDDFRVSFWEQELKDLKKECDWYRNDNNTIKNELYGHMLIE